MAEEMPESRPLDDVMLAMDVVDTLRHQQLLVERELNTDDRDQKMIERLRGIYASQGIEVPDHVLQEGVVALKEDRFVYDRPGSGFQTWLARLYVMRGKWGKPLLLVVGTLSIVWFAYIFLVSGPAEREKASLPARLQSQYQLLEQQAKGPAAKERSRMLLETGNSALQQNDTDALLGVLDKMGNLQSEIDLQYELRIVSRPGEKSGVWRIPDANIDARNFYIIVEALTPDGRVLELPVVNEEDGRTYQAKKWGLRVSEEEFERISSDKMDDGIIQDNRFGMKRKGYLEPEYSKPTTGNAITSW